MLNNLFLAVAVGLVLLGVFMPSDSPRCTPPGHGLRRRVLRHAVAFPENSTPKENADAPDGTAAGEEQVNKFHALQNRAAHKQDER